VAFPARVFRVLIASPSDVVEERDIAVTTIQQWNDLNSSERQVVLLPMRWETHSAPEYGKRPQEVINRQVVDSCDLLVGVFWTRVGSPTGAADSGTLEEIERVANHGKLVMLYFSQVKQDPERIDLDQLKKLRDFKQKAFPKALVETYSNQIEFRDKLAKHLEIQLRTLLAEGVPGIDETSQRPANDIQLALADPQTGAFLGTDITVEAVFLIVEGQENLPDYQTRNKMQATTINAFYGSVGDGGFIGAANKNYYKDLAAYYARKSLLRPIRFWLKNAGAVGVRDCYVDIRMTSNKKGLTIWSGSNPNPAPNKSTSPIFDYSLTFPDSSGDLEPEQRGNEWAAHLEVSALQPQREISPRHLLALASPSSAHIEINAKIYADTLSEPILRKLSVDWRVKRVTVDAMELVKDAINADAEQK
jgi:hypothetical protein